MKRLLNIRKVATVSMTLAIATFTACSDDYKQDDEGNYPSWLGNSIYAVLQEPRELLDGTFNYYMQLIKDLNYEETLAKTGSKTIFPANDEAFEKFFKNNTWGVSGYNDLTEAMKKKLLYSSMLDNAIQTDMLSNVSTQGNIIEGEAIKHITGMSVTDSISWLKGNSLPVNNSYWDDFRTAGINLVMDGTTPMIVHFTNNQMVQNSITTNSDSTDSDFKVLTGSEYEDGMVYVFRNKVINSDVVCKNGYIHQVEDVLVPPGNLGELIRTNGESNYFSRMLDRFSAPFINDNITQNYNDYAKVNNLPTKDAIYEKRYFSSISQGFNELRAQTGSTVNEGYILKFDPGWNQYGPTSEEQLSDMGAIFVPTDDAMWNYFQPNGKGAFIIERYGKLDNTLANLPVNIDSIPKNIVQTFINNLMQQSFVNTVPSKFKDIMNTASDPMGITLQYINKESDGKYDVKIASNGVAYMLNTVFAPVEFSAVSAPALFSDSMHIINWAIQDPLGTLDFKFDKYLLAMNANYALFLPTDEAFANGLYYVDPAYLGHTQKRVLKFYWKENDPTEQHLYCTSYVYDPETGEPGSVIENDIKISNLRTQLQDILNYHTVVLENSTEGLGDNKYYLTKHGGVIKYEDNAVEGGGQIYNELPKSNITRTYIQENGKAYAIDHLIQPTQQSVYKVLSETDDFKEFYNLCAGFSNGDLLEFAGYSGKADATTGASAQDELVVFYTNGGKCLDQNMKILSNYNYTIYVPDNNAMQTAYSRGLPSWDDVQRLYDNFADAEDSQYKQDAKQMAKDMVREMNRFVRYHIQDNSIFADNIIDGGTYLTSCYNDDNIYQKLNVSGGNGTINVTDNAGQTVTINSSTDNYNIMARDYNLNAAKATATAIASSAFAVIHQIGTPLSHHTGNNYNTENKW